MVVPCAADPLELLPERGAALRVEPLGRLVEDEHLGPVHQRAAPGRAAASCRRSRSRSASWRPRSAPSARAARRRRRLTRRAACAAGGRPAPASRGRWRRRPGSASAGPGRGACAPRRAAWRRRSRPRGPCPRSVAAGWPGCGWWSSCPRRWGPGSRTARRARPEGDPVERAGLAAVDLDQVLDLDDCGVVLFGHHGLLRLTGISLPISLLDSLLSLSGSYWNDSMLSIRFRRRLFEQLDVIYWS